MSAISSNSLAIIAAVLGAIAAVSAGLSALQANRETEAAVSRAKADASVKIAAVAKNADVKIAKVRAAADIEIAALNNDAGRLRERAASAELQLARITAGVGARQVTRAQKARIVRALRGKVTGYFVATGEFGDPESSAYAAQIADALVAAGMHNRMGPYPANAIGTLRSTGNPMTMYSPHSGGEGWRGNEHDLVYLALKHILHADVGASNVAFVDGKESQLNYYFIQVGIRSAPVLEKVGK